MSPVKTRDPPPKMASPAVAVATQPHLNGSASVPQPADLSRPGSPISINSSTKRKRDVSDDGDTEMTGGDAPKPTVNGVHPTSRDRKLVIRDFYQVLQRLVHSTFSIRSRSTDFPFYLALTQTPSTSSSGPCLIPMQRMSPRPSGPSRRKAALLLQSPTR